MVGNGPAFLLKRLTVNLKSRLPPNHMEVFTHEKTDGFDVRAPAVVYRRMQ